MIRPNHRQSRAGIAEYAPAPSLRAGDLGLLPASGHHCLFRLVGHLEAADWSTGF